MAEFDHEMHLDNTDAKRRSSSRSIKRRRFDDELVEFSLNTTVPSVNATVGRPRIRTISSGLSDAPALVSGEIAGPSRETSAPAIRAKRKYGLSLNSPQPSGSLRRRKLKHGNFMRRDIGRWKAIDDLMLIQGVIQTCDLKAVYNGTKFSCKFTPQEISQRWNQLVYNKIISENAQAAIGRLPEETVDHISRNALFSSTEEELLSSIKSTSEPSLAVFKELMMNYRQIFHAGRTAKVLRKHWISMRRYSLLADQQSTDKHPFSLPLLATTEERNNVLLHDIFGTVDGPVVKCEPVPIFQECEELLSHSAFGDVKSIGYQTQRRPMERTLKKDLRKLEVELTNLNMLMNTTLGAKQSEFDTITLASLRGKCVRFLMRSKEITLGRATESIPVDVNLELEGPADKISRKQATIRMRNNGEFTIRNQGRRPIFVDGNPIIKGDKFMIRNNSILEIVGLRFMFLINEDFIKVIRKEALKNQQQKNDQPPVTEAK